MPCGGDGCDGDKDEADGREIEETAAHQ